ncbi:hypothetical protein RRG08_024649 [Elysia crispata]|uniref:Uncharacterized protein n=1 Tax=Elysia crispata TaxID=231223 RepID=A0AAE0ZXR5_9GAST|nr:hypothetical protein RRG08_024649 [Elysia crispata]
MVEKVRGYPNRVRPSFDDRGRESPRLSQPSQCQNISTIMGPTALFVVVTRGQTAIDMDRNSCDTFNLLDFPSQEGPAILHTSGIDMYYVLGHRWGLPSTDF